MTALITQNTTLIDHLDNMHRTFCVYSVSMFSEAQQQDQLVYIGVTKLMSVFNLEDARRNTAFITMVNPRTVITLQITHTGERIDCMNERGKILLSMNPRPICNMLGVDTMGNRGKIVCNETGQTFDTQSECAQLMGIQQGRLSLHLAGKPGANSVKGYTFRRAII